MTTPIANNIFFDPLQLIYDVLNQNIKDPNTVRASLPTEGQRRWIFPSYPEANDENYPRIAVLFGTPRHNYWTPYNFYDWGTDPSGNINREVFSNLITLPVMIGVFTKKTRHKPLEVVDYDGTRRWVENSAQVAFLLNQVQKEIFRHRDRFIAKEMDFTMTGIEAVYEDSDFLWAGHINLELLFHNIWYGTSGSGSDGEFTSGDLIATITKTVTVDMDC